jgi:hypothetical protein
MAEAKKENPTRIITGKVRLSYLHAHTPQASDDNPNRLLYSVQLLIPKTDTVTIAKINKAIEFLKTDSKSIGVWGSKWLASFKTPLRDGDTEKDTDKSPEYKGMYFINCNSKQKPQVVGTKRDIEGKLIPLGEDEVYSGGWGRVSINLYAYNQSGGIGIAAGLNNIQWLEDGERLGGRSDANEDFGPDTEDDDSFLD